jgi:hypothetical protein
MHWTMVCLTPVMDILMLRGCYIFVGQHFRGGTCRVNFRFSRTHPYVHVQKPQNGWTIDSCGFCVSLWQGPCTCNSWLSGVFHWNILSMVVYLEHTMNCTEPVICLQYPCTCASSQMWLAALGFHLICCLFRNQIQQLAMSRLIKWSDCS